MRTSTVSSRDSPTGRTVFSCTTRSSLTCMCSGKSATSSRNNVPPFGALHEALLVGHRAGEAAALVAEQLTLHELRRDGTAVHRDERPFAARTRVVNESGDELFTRARFAKDVHRCLAARDARNHLAQLLHGRRAADEARARCSRGGLTIRACAAGEPRCRRACAGHRGPAAWRQNRRRRA